MAKIGRKSGVALGGAALVTAMGLVVPWEGRDSTAIMTSEGKRYVAYQDIVGVWTACDGITRGVKPGAKYSGAECDASLAVELQRANGYIEDCITTKISAKERGAYVSAGYNLGPILMCGNTQLQRKLNAGDRRGACLELTKWVNAGGKFVQGLFNRRKAEQKVCLAGVDGA